MPSTNIEQFVPLRLAAFITKNSGAILLEWDDFARTRIPAAATMDPRALRDHASEMLQAIALDLGAAQTEDQRGLKSRGLAIPSNAEKSAATLHGALRHRDGFELDQLASEFRALRAVVLRLWKAHRALPDRTDMDDIERFNEGVDQALAESIAAFSAEIAESRDTFLAVLGHDLRQPLSAMKGCLELLERADAPALRKERALRIAGRSVRSMEELITDLLEYTKTRLGRGVQVVAVPGDFSAFLDDAVDQAREGHPKARFDIQIASGCDADFDAARMRQVVSNLLSNAVQHGDRTSAIVVVLRAEGDRLELRVNNAGVPIPANALQVIFNPLVQVPGGPTEPHERPSTSMGLGLFIAREIVEAHGGTIEATSTTTAGTTFTVCLPRKQGIPLRSLRIVPPIGLPALQKRGVAP